jgi:hypothetical protein
MTDVATMTLIDFLLARIAEDEAVARDSLALYGPGSSLYVARHDPARVLAECAAKRRIIAAHEAADFALNDDVIRLLALPYAEHPDFDEAWRP